MNEAQYHAQLDNLMVELEDILDEAETTWTLSLVAV